MLTFATLNNDLKIFNNFERLSNKNEFKIIDYVFYDNGQLKNNNEDVAERLFDLAQAKDSSNLYYPGNIDYYLFYLNLALNFNPQFNE